MIIKQKIKNAASIEFRNFKSIGMGVLMILAFLGCKEKQQDEQTTSDLNGPFIVQSLAAETNFDAYGRSGELIQHGITLLVRNEDKEPPTNAKGEVMPVTVSFEVIAQPDGANMELFTGGEGSSTATDDQGRANVGIRLGSSAGVYVVRATLPDFFDSVDAFITIYTEGITSKLTVLPFDPVSVDEPLQMQVRATDWLDAPVENANLLASFVSEDFPEIPPQTFEGTSEGDGIFTFNLQSEYAAKQWLTIGDESSEFTIEEEIAFLPGTVSSLEFLPVENPRHQPPYDQTTVELRALDNFGNIVPMQGVDWSTSTGNVKPISPSEGTSAAAHLNFEQDSIAQVTATFEKLSTSTRVDLPGVYLRPVEENDYAFVGDSFRVQVEVFPSSGGGMAKALSVAVSSPGEAAEFVSATDHDDMIPPVSTSTDAEGNLRLTIEKMEVPLSEKTPRLVVTELLYTCLNELEACLEVMSGDIVIQRSPNRNHALHPGLRYCRPQKERREKQLCLNFCLVTKPGGKTFAQLKTLAEAEVAKAQQHFDNNIANCCPKVKIKACYNNLTWREYRPIVNGGAKPGKLEGGIWKEGGNSTFNRNDATKDAWKLSPELKNLLKKCRKANCNPVYMVPEVFHKRGRWYKGWAVTISPNDFPETTGAQNSGTGIIMTAGLDVNNNVLIHELGHLLIDLPRNEDGGNEHKGIRDRKRFMISNPKQHRQNFSAEECSHIWSNIDSYNGDCN
ncbi:Ig-like domain-containing protein [Flagellimonas allohymeniacidonis]|uniref:Big-1 domain-containing protein n=1 Tax=Flagellimonas allohymeniacidonis TaxID=2517819 RepID=A0A4Q8QMU5_9FLAO|nr:Ig-like domain-containing protein [Allomuricauda hymeniacidonis]TAI49636.1 hypothetical protein EW142_07520 [Allomuricauda hymeniacidonis]